MATMSSTMVDFRPLDPVLEPLLEPLLDVEDEEGEEDGTTIICPSDGDGRSIIVS